MSARDEMQGNLSRDEQALHYSATAAQLLAFLDCHRSTIGPPLRGDGSGWLVTFDQGAFWARAWGPRPLQVTTLERQCATLTEAVDTIRRYEQRLPL